MITTAIKKKMGDIDDLISGYTPVSLDENSKVKVDGESVSAELLRMYRKLEQKYKSNPQDFDLLFKDFRNKIFSPKDIFIFSSIVVNNDSSIKPYVTTLLDRVIVILIQESYNVGNNGFTIATDNNEKIYGTFPTLEGRKGNLLKITFAGDLSNDLFIPGSVILGNNDYLDITVNGILNESAFNSLRSSKVKVYGKTSLDNYNDSIAENTKNSTFEFYETVLAQGEQLGEKSRDCEFIFYKEVLDLSIGKYSNISKFTFYGSVINTTIGGADNRLKTNNKKTVDELVNILVESEKIDIHFACDTNHKSSNNKIYFIEPDGTEKLVWYVDKRGTVVKNR